MDQETLFALLSATALGNKNAFSQLYQSTSSQLYGVSLKLLGRKDLAEEALQDAFVKIWHNAAEYQYGKGKVLTWMTSIVRYRALDLIRHHKIRKEESLLDEHTDLIYEEDKSTSTQSISSHYDLPTDKLNYCIDQLGSDQKQAIHLAYVRGLSHHEVVRHLSLPLGTIKSWIRRGLQQLQRCLSI